MIRAGVQHLGSLDDDCVCWQVDSPRKRGCAAEDFDVAFSKQFLHEVSIGTKHASMVNAKAGVEQLLQLPVAGSQHILSNQPDVRV